MDMLVAVLKSVLTGVLAVVTAAVLLVIVMVAWLSSIKAPPGTAVGWDPVTLVQQIGEARLLATVALIFFLGFVLGFRRFRPVAR